MALDIPHFSTLLACANEVSE
jgi:hypothetical protein